METVRIALLMLALLLVGSDDCEPTAPSPPELEPAGYCDGTEGVIDSTLHHAAGTYAAILGGYPAEDRLSVVHVLAINKGSCTGGIINRRTILLAGHCNGPNGYLACLHPDHGPCWETNKSTIHPGYYRWKVERGEPHDDIMLLHFDVDLPGPYPKGYYDSSMTARCVDVSALGWGATSRPGAKPPPEYEKAPCPDVDGDGNPDSRCLQQSAYKVNFETETTLDVAQATWGGKCFGDSGSILYVKVEGEDGHYMAGTTSTVNDLECIRGGTDVKLSYYKPWIEAHASL